MHPTPSQPGYRADRAVHSPAPLTAKQHLGHSFNAPATFLIVNPSHAMGERMADTSKWTSALLYLQSSSLWAGMLLVCWQPWEAVRAHVKVVFQFRDLVSLQMEV